jgi:hypothetical protein
MNKLIIILWILAAWALPKAYAEARELPRQILGVHLNMTKDEAHKRLQEIGTFERDERKQQEIWKVRDESFSHLIIGFGKDEKLRFVTAVAREDKEAKRVAYDKIGSLKEAEQAGDPQINNFNYQWSLSTKGTNETTLIVARGRDPQFLATYSLKRLVGDETAAGSD